MLPYLTKSTLKVLPVLVRIFCVWCVVFVWYAEKGCRCVHVSMVIFGHFFFPTGRYKLTLDVFLYSIVIFKTGSLIDPGA